MTVCKQPQNDAGQHVESFEIETTPGSVLHDYEDCFGNAACFFDIPGEHQELLVDARSIVGIHPPKQKPDEESPGWDALSGLESGNLWHFLNPTPLTEPTPLLASFAKEQKIKRLSTPLASLKRLSHQLNEAIAYDSEATLVTSTADHALEERRGVCQDYAHIMLAITRGWGVPSRYVSGYLHAERPEDPDARMARGSHAWVECLLPGIGWVGFDPTNDSMPGERHVRVATGRDYRDVPPTRGTFRGAVEQELEVSVSISRLRPDSHSEDEAWPEFANT